MPIYSKQVFGYCFSNQSLLCQALTHPSYLNEARETARVDYQRLEFLGDAVLGLLLADLLFQRFPDLPEGDLSRLRSTLVDQSRLAELAGAAEIAPLILMGKGAEREGGRENPSILADVFEALIGAMYQEAGFAAAHAAVERMYSPLLTDLTIESVLAHDAKSELQELLAAQKRPAPVYSVVADEGPAHDRYFRVSVTVAGELIAEGEGRSKKIAQQAAAREALVILKGIS